MDNKNMLRITFALIAGVVLGYMLATSGINNSDQAARGINADLSIGTSKGAVKPNPKVLSVYNFIEPNNTSIWQIGSFPNVEWDTPLPYVNNCGTTKVFLIDLANNSIVGQIWIDGGVLNPNGASFTWSGTQLWDSNICNANKQLVTFGPSKYKLRIEQTDLNNPAAPMIIFESNQFTIQ